VVVSDPIRNPPGVESRRVLPASADDVPGFRQHPPLAGGRSRTWRIKVNQRLTYSTEPDDKAKFTREYDRMYTIFARVYDLAVKVLPVWRTWLKQTLPHIRGQKVLEVSFGTGYLLTQYADRFESHGIDYNEKLVSVASGNLEKKGMTADLRQGNVESLPYEDETFDCVVNTMAFTAYPDGRKAMSELHRVLKTGGRLVLIDIGYPGDRNWLGMKMTRFWAALGDIIRDMGAMFREFHFEYTDREIGGFGSVHLYLAEKK
jgi:ubiquinone/menaquinone biosynthesis C-methylase UbiE